MSAPRADPVAARGVAKRFGPTVALDGVDLVAAPGETVALMGPNGSGKSTLLRILVGAVLPDRGTVAIDRGRLGWVLGDEHSWYWRLSGLQNLEVFGAMRGLRLRDARREGRELLADLGLAEAAGRAVAQYSTGMKARLALARARLGSPSAILLDEPSRGLDSDAEEAFLAWLGATGVTLVMSTHSVAEAALADRVLVLDDGRLVRELTGRLDVADLEAALHGDR